MSNASVLRRPFRTMLAVTTLAASLALLAPGRAEAGAITVTRFDDPVPGACDPGDCSLREAIMAANVAPSANSIALQNGTYQLAVPGTGEDAALDGDLDITDGGLTITGQGPGKTTIDSGGAATGERTFHVHTELTLTGVTVRNSVETSSLGRAGLYGEPGSTLTLRNVVVSGHVNNSTTGDAYGSGINSDGTLNLFDVVSTGNTAPIHCCSGVFHFPGGVASTGSLTARNVTVSDNTDSTGPAPTTNCCSGFFTRSPDPRTLEHVVSTNNRSATDCCTGMFVDGTGPATLSDITILNNDAAAQCCSGLYLGSPATVTRGTVSANRAQTDCCAGIYAVAPVTLNNVTVSGNIADECCSGITATPSAPLSVNNVTVTGNTGNADNAGAEDGAGLVDTGGGITTSNTISTGNIVGTGSSGADCFGTVTSQGYNLIGSTADCTFIPGPGDILAADPKLGPLADNGGPHPTHALGKGSPAIDAGNPAIARVEDGPACESTDQRGVPRKKCDIGAYELTRCMGIVVNRVGTAGKDKLRGTKGKDGFLGFGGKDTLIGKKRKDGLCGGGGKDKLKGGPGKDRLNGQGGKDLCIGGPGFDRARRCERERSI